MPIEQLPVPGELPRCQPAGLMPHRSVLRSNASRPYGLSGFAENTVKSFWAICAFSGTSKAIRSRRDQHQRMQGFLAGCSMSADTL
jgi:hypothetical protein